MAGGASRSPVYHGGGGWAAGGAAMTTPQLAHLHDRLNAWLADDATPAAQRPGLAHALAVVDAELAERLATLVFVDDGASFGAALEETARGLGIRPAPPARSRPVRMRTPAPGPAGPVALGSGVGRQPGRGRRPVLGSGVCRGGR